MVRGPRTQPTRNGGRHCCQPPLRRDLGLPVFACSQGALGDPRLPRSLLTSSGVAFVSIAAPSSEALSPVPPASLSLRKAALPGPVLPSLAFDTPCGASSAPDHPCGQTGLSLRLSSCPAAPARSLRPLPSPLRTLGPSLVRCRPRPPIVVPRPFLGQSLASPLPVGPRTFPAWRDEEDHLFRRLLPTSLSGDPSQGCRRPGETGPAREFHSGAFAGGDRCFVPLPVRSDPLRSPSLPAGAAAPDHPVKLTRFPIRA